MPVQLKPREDQSVEQGPAPFASTSGVRRVAERTQRRLPISNQGSNGKQPLSSLAAVEQFSRQHEYGFEPGTQYYRNLIPLEKPGPGEQYAFQVDLDACTGCKACVVACHVMNGLDEDESFRTVGILHGGSPELPVRQTVTAACHHCVEPACLSGCPVAAYEKSPLTGIVKHLDDQCIGCQYCTLMCPYDVPQYNEARGIVRKCDMCSDRLAHDEAPACVDACPNDAISIRTIVQAAAVSAADAGVFLPGVAAPKLTLPTTVYASAEAMPSNLLPADYYRSTVSHWHVPLVLMLTFTQLAVGEFVLSLISEISPSNPAHSHFRAAAFALTVTLIALVASVFHLGRPAQAWRVIVGLRTSWLSREAVLFGVFFKALLLCCLIGGLGRAVLEWPLGATALAALPALEIVTGLLGLLGVYCSVMVYVATRRLQWSSVLTGFKFFGSTVVLGTAGTLLLNLLSGSPSESAASSARSLALGLAIVAFAKLAFEALLLRDAGARQHSARKQVATTMLGALRKLTLARFAAGVFGAALPLMLLSHQLSASSSALLAACALFLLCTGELLERALFFGTAPALRMPGGMP